MKKILLVAAALLNVTISNAQQVRPAGSAKIYHELRQLGHLVNVLYVAAHPDDENTRLLAWLVNEKDVRTAYLSLTRGDGGQNILGSEQGEALGLIRTHELIEARKLDGAEQFFSRAIDFGFSKTHEETFKHWPQNLLVGDAVSVMRRFRPDVVILRFPPDTRAGHGQHAASSIVGTAAFREVYGKGGDDRPKRLLLNTYRFGDRNTTSEDQFKLPVGEYLPAFGQGCGELAGQSRSVHKSQGAGTPSVPGLQTEYFMLVAGDSLRASLFDGIDITWGRVGRGDIAWDIKMITDHFDFMQPDASLPALLSLRKKIAGVEDVYWRQQKLHDIDDIILHCAGFMAELYAKQPQAVAGSSLPFTLHLIARSGTPVRVTGIRWLNNDSATNFALPSDTLITFEHTISIPSSAQLTQPYWLSLPHLAGADIFSVPEDSLLGLPETPVALNGTVMLSIDGVDFAVTVPVSYKKLDPVKGDIVEQLRIVPDVTVAFNNALLVTAPDGLVRAEVRLHAYKDIKDATLTVSGQSPLFTASGFNLANGSDTVIALTISPQVSHDQGDGDFYLYAKVNAAGKEYSLSQHVIQYNHLPTLQYFTDPYARVLRNNWKCTAKRIGYIEGAGDLVPSFLRQAGLEIDILKEGDLTNAASLKKYDAIITGIRAVNVEKRMAYWLPVLHQYAANGGTLIMQYNTLQDLATTKLGPYPFILTGDRVTEEDAKIDFTDPKHRVLNYPNKITDADFMGWVQERGLYFAAKWDAAYTPLFSMHDAGEQPLTGGTLYAKTGKGHYIYTSLSFSRQVPAGNKGAIRLLMNMLSVGK